ncbi:MAG: hypothetical protein QXR53_04115 [Candidatus Norongarragalinales archaeon]
MNKPVVKKKGDDGFAEVSFSESARALEGKGEEQVVGTNPLTQKPIIKSVEKKPFVKAIFEKPESEEELIAQDITVAELRKRQLHDITPVSNAPQAEEKRELSKEEAADLARKIWEEKDKKKSWHHKLMGRFGFK